MNMSKSEARKMLARDTKQFSAVGGIIECIEAGIARGVQKQCTGGGYTSVKQSSKRNLAKM